MKRKPSVKITVLLFADHLRDDVIQRLLLSNQLVICFDGDWGTGQAGEPNRFSLTPLYLYEALGVQ